MTLERRINGYFGEFTCKQHELLINISHPSKSVMLFGRFTNDIFPGNIREIADNIHELYEVLKEIGDDKIVISQDYELVLVMSIGRKTKEYVIPLQKAEMSNEQSLKKKVDELQKQLEKVTFEANFFKEQYQFLLKHLQLKPNLEELQKIYVRKNLSELFEEKGMKESKLTSYSNNSIFGSGIKQQLIFKCPNDHQMEFKNQPIKDSLRFCCNVCRTSYDAYSKRMKCITCDFDVCEKCLNIPPQQRKYCPNLHALVFGSASNYQYRLCDSCEKCLGVNKGYSCTSCDFDLCKGCI